MKKFTFDKLNFSFYLVVLTAVSITYRLLKRFRGRKYSILLKTILFLILWDAVGNKQSWINLSWKNLSKQIENYNKNIPTVGIQLQ